MGNNTPDMSVSIEIMEDKQNEPLMVMVAATAFPGQPQMIQIKAQGLKASAEGASELSALFSTLGATLREKLGADYVEQPLLEDDAAQGGFVDGLTDGVLGRPRFNPQPRKGNKPYVRGED